MVSLEKGIAQGTVLGPILFIFYINGIFDCTSLVHMSLFADDCGLYLSGNNWPTVHHKIEEDFDAILHWTFRNGLHLNPIKTKGMIFSTRNRLSNLRDPEPFEAHGHEISFVKQHAYLGILIDSMMTMSPLIKDIKKRLTNKIFMLRKIRHFLTFDAAVTVYNQTILPSIDYAGFLLILCKNDDKHDLQVLQNDIKYSGGAEGGGYDPMAGSTPS